MIGTSLYNEANSSDTSPSSFVVVVVVDSCFESSSPFAPFESAFAFALASLRFSLFNSVFDGPSRSFFSSTTLDFFSSFLGPKSSPVFSLYSYDNDNDDNDDDDNNNKNDQLPNFNLFNSSINGARSSFNVGDPDALSVLISSPFNVILFVSSSAISSLIVMLLLLLLLLFINQYNTTTILCCYKTLLYYCCYNTIDHHHQHHFLSGCEEPP